MKTQYTFNIILAFVFLFSSCKHDPIAQEMEEMAKENNVPGYTVSEDTSKPCDPDTVYFVNEILPIINSNCAFSGCHGDGSAEKGVDLTSYKSIINTAEIMPFNPKESKLYDAITETKEKDIMPPPPANKLSTEQISKIRKWIEQGALNNYCVECDTSSVTFNKVIAPIIQNNCQGCHSGSSPSGGIPLTDHSQIQIQALSGKLYGVVNHVDGYVAMPYKQTKLDQCKIDQIRIWIENGALND